MSVSSKGQPQRRLQQAGLPLAGEGVCGGSPATDVNRAIRVRGPDVWSVIYDLLMPVAVETSCGFVVLDE